MAPSRIENPTLIERFVKLIPLPYPLAALVWAAIIPSGPISYLTQYIASGPAPFSFPNAVLNLLLPFYLFYMARYMRQKVVVSEAPIAARLSGGVEDYQRAFGRMTQSLPALLITAFAGTVILVAYASAGILPPIPSIIPRQHNRSLSQQPRILNLPLGIRSSKHRIAQARRILPETRIFPR